MSLHTPQFWYKKDAAPGWRSTALLPLSWLYGLGRKLHVARAKPYKAGIPVICIGNLTAGGAGKTPTAIALMQMVKTLKIAKNPHFLTRGYGGAARKAVLAKPDIHDANDVGDEALLLAVHAPTIISPNRADGAALAENIGADLIIMDDGFQNHQLAKDFSLLVIDGQSGFGNQYMLPAGPLREPLGAGLARADAFMIIGEDKHNIAVSLPMDKPLLNGTITPHVKNLDKEARYLAFAGLGQPEKFRATLEGLSFSIAAWQSFPDHYPYTQSDLKTLKSNAAALRAQLITTEKDFMRLKHLQGADDIHVLPISMKIDNATELEKQLQNLS